MLLLQSVAMISCLSLIPRGAAKETPEQQELSAEEMEQLIQKQAGMSMQEMVHAQHIKGIHKGAFHSHITQTNRC